MIHQVSTHKLGFAASTHDKILLMRQGFDAVLEIKDAPVDPVNKIS